MRSEVLLRMHRDIRRRRWARARAWLVTGFVLGIVYSRVVSPWVLGLIR